MSSNRYSKAWANSGSAASASCPDRCAGRSASIGSSGGDQVGKALHAIGARRELEYSGEDTRRIDGLDTHVAAVLPNRYQRSVPYLTGERRAVGAPARRLRRTGRELAGPEGAPRRRKGGDPTGAGAVAQDGK